MPNICRRIDPDAVPRGIGERLSADAGLACEKAEQAISKFRARFVTPAKRSAKRFGGDFDEAAKWIRTVAEGGHSEAQAMLAAMRSAE